MSYRAEKLGDGRTGGHTHQAETQATTIPTGDPLHSRAACTQPCNVNIYSRAHCSPVARLCEQWGHGCVNNGARLCASARLCRGSPVILEDQNWPRVKWVLNGRLKLSTPFEQHLLDNYHFNQKNTDAECRWYFAQRVLVKATISMLCFRV